MARYHWPVTTKRGATVSARTEELDRALRKPRRILWVHCRHHGGGYYFYGISIQTWGPGEQERWTDEPDMRKVRGTCMKCAKRSIFFVNEAELDEHRYRPIELCPRCGLPYDHEAPSSAFLRQYNALPVFCRQNSYTNGQPTKIR